jgi:Tol biopolymer transport system component
VAATRAVLAATVRIACCGALLGSACARPRVVVLDGVAGSTVAAFDRAAAVPAASLRITSFGEGSVIPSDWSYPLVEWRAAGGPADAFMIELRSGRVGLDVVLKGTSWRPDRGEFEPFLARRDVVVTVYQLTGGKTVRSEPVRLVVAVRPLRQRVVFRAVQPLFNPTLPNALMAFVPGTRALQTVLELEGTCVGCHAYAAGAAFLNLKQGGERRLVVARRAGASVETHGRDLGPFSFLAPSPGGRYAVYVNAPVGDLALKQTAVEPFDYPYRSGDIFVLDVRTGRTAPLPGAAEPGVVEDMPSFSPDGRRVIFSRSTFDAPAGRVPSMELAEVPFNGGEGGEATPVAGASGGGMWHYFARYSPDGKWISFCRGDASHGVYARRSSDIWLLPAAGGVARRLRLNAEGAMDSWHSWSSDSRWLAFSSNREGTGMTALYLAYVDDDGNAAPPVKLAGFDAMKVNTPQFVPDELDLAALGDLTAPIDAAFAAQ